MELLRDKIYLIVSLWGYPFGGGEEYLNETMYWAYEYGMKSYWISFSLPNNKPYDKLEIKNNQYGKIINVPGGFTEKKLLNWLRLLNPDIVHHQGHLRSMFYNPCELLRINFMTGIHFWNGIIQLDSVCKNIDVIENSDKHTVDPEFKQLIEKKYCHFYIVSPFLQKAVEKITGHTINDMIYSGSSVKMCKIPKINILKNKYVTIINIHKLKGGDLICHLLKTLLDIPFQLVRTEHGSEELDDQIKKIVEYRNNNNIPCKLIERVNDPKIIFRETKILLAPSLVDETFCRTANEAMMNGIPVITSGQGNLKYLVDNNDLIISPNEPDKWEEMILQLYNNESELLKYSKYCLEKYDEFSEQKGMQMFGNMVYKLIKQSKDNNIMIIAPWCDQGLGIQSRNYYNILKDEYDVFIFSFKPYNAENCIQLQKDPKEWEVPNIYYSSNDREHIKPIEIIDFVKKYNIGKAIIPETCWDNIFSIAKLLRSLNVKTYAIPNIEIVQKSEIFKHNYFYKILCNNYLCQNIFNRFNITKTEYIGYGIMDNISFKSKNLDNVYKFLFIGGMNAFSRKHLLSICEAFSIVQKRFGRNNFILTCTIQRTNSLEIEDKNRIEQYKDNPNFVIIQDHLSYADIINLYYDHHISVQVSKHEGLGLGFYEAIYTGTPIITLNTPPHNEIILDEKNGWLIPCYYKKMTDNKDPIFDSAYFDPNFLAFKIDSILSMNQTDFKLLLNNLEEDYESRLSYDNFRERFLNSISK